MPKRSSRGGTLRWVATHMDDYLKFTVYNRPIDMPPLRPRSGESIFFSVHVNPTLILPHLMVAREVGLIADRIESRPRQIVAIKDSNPVLPHRPGRQVIHGVDSRGCVVIPAIRRVG